MRDTSHAPRPSSRANHRAAAFVAAAVCVFAGGRARADVLHIETLEERTWSAAVAALQTDRGSEGHVIHVVVREGDGTRVHCGTYTIGLDEAAAEAFEVDGCDRKTDSTAVRLVHRSALFDHGDVVPRPRQPRIVASRTQTGEAQGGAKSAAESAMDCLVTVRPFIRDLENGGRVDLMPGRYALRTRTDDVKVSAIDDGWTFSATRGARITVDYYITDLKKAEVVLNDRVTMDCSIQTSTGTGVVPREVLSTKPYVQSAPEPEQPAESEGKSDTPAWHGRAFTANFGVGSAFMRTSGLKLANNSGASDADALGLHDAAGPVVLVAGAYERPGIYGSLGASMAATQVAHRTLWNFGVTSVVAAALHFGDASIYLGPDVQIGSYQASSDTSESLAYGSKLALTLGGAMGLRLHFRDEKTGKVNQVLGLELVAPVAGPAPWFLTAQIGFGSGS